MARSQPWPRCDVTLPAPARSAACCVRALAVDEAAGWSRVAEDPFGLAALAAVIIEEEEEAEVLWTASAASVRAATGVLDGCRGSWGRMLGSWGRSPCTQQSALCICLLSLGLNIFCHVHSGCLLAITG